MKKIRVCDIHDDLQIHRKSTIRVQLLSISVIYGLDLALSDSAKF